MQYQHVFLMFIPYQSFLHLIPAHQREIWIPSLEKQQIIEYNTVPFTIWEKQHVARLSSSHKYVLYNFIVEGLFYNFTV